MKILHVNLSNRGGGIEQYLDLLFPELSRRGHNSVFIYGEHLSGPSCADHAESHYIEGVAGMRGRGNPEKLKAVESILDASRPDVAYIHQVLNPDLIRILARSVPTVRYVHGFKLVCPEGKKMLRTAERHCPFELSLKCQIRAYRYKCMPRNPWLGIPLISAAMRNRREHRQYSQMIVASEFMKKVLLYNGFNARQIAVCPYFTHERGTREKIEEDVPIVLAMGRLVPAKGMHLLIEAFAGLDAKARLVIIGDGPDMETLKAVAERNGLNGRETFLGWLDNEACRKWIDRSRVVVVPSIWPEPFGIVGIEAMASGKPVAAFDSGGISAWLVQGQTGYLVPTGDIAALKEKIRVLLRDPELANEMGKNGFAYYREHFGPDVHLSVLLGIFRKTMEDTRETKSET